MMSNLTQEFFWQPEELVHWTRRVCSEFGLWLAVWRVGKNADLMDPGALQASMFEDAQDDSIQLFLGKASLSHEPQWRIVGDRRELDFVRSYAVQLVPSVLSADGQTLLQGRLAILRAANYDNKTRAEELVALFRRLKSELKRDSDAGRVVVQPLPSGDRKRWNDMLVGKAVSASKLKLKQFLRGEVEFQVESA